MVREQVAGAIVLDTLRDRIISGRYLGYWRPGERLPSIREIAEAEQVDRKTAAAAYRRLQEEGLVQVRPRSGVYLCSTPTAEVPGPLERLHRHWLQHTYEGARALGLETRTILRLVTAVAEVERLRIPVIECNWAQAEVIAEELRGRMAIQAMPYLLDELRPGDPALAEAPVLVTTPYHAAELGLVAPRRVIIEANMPPDLLRDLRRHATGGRVVVATPNGELATKVRGAMVHCGVPSAEDTALVLSAVDRADLIAASRRARVVFIWPGTPTWVEESLPATARVVRPGRCVSDESIARIQAAILDAAIRRVRSTPKPQEVRVS